MVRCGRVNRLGRRRRYGAKPLLQAIVLAGLNAGSLPGAPADEPATLQTNLCELSLQQLLDVSIVSASQRPQRIMETPAAAFIVTADDIRRSGAATVADALRMVPGITVGHLHNASWFVSSRGFFTTTDKLLVLVDGRSVYSPLHSGLPWDITDVPIEDVERIEVIRGPGGAVWGANAVNGVVNIITKNARDTQGTLISGGGGTEERIFGTSRYGGQAGSNTYYRIWAKGFERDGMADTRTQSAPSPPAPEWDGGRTGGRVDWSEAQDSAMLSGELFLYRYYLNPPHYSLTPPYYRTESDLMEATGGYVIGRYRHELSATSDWEVQAYFDHIDRQIPFLNSFIDTVDVGAKHHFRAGQRQDLVWGGGYRSVDYHHHDSFEFSLDPDGGNPDQMNLFAQDEIGIVPDRLALILGTKFEYGDLGGSEWQPTARLLFTPTTAQTLWFAVSRAVRSPSIVEQDGTVNGVVKPPDSTPGSLPTFLAAQGSDDFGSEKALAYEAGYRVQPLRNLFVDLATFYTEYRDVRTLDLTAPVTVESPVPHIEQPRVANNGLEGSIQGAELSVDWAPFSRWRLVSAYTYMTDKLERSEDSVGKAYGDTVSPDPRYAIDSGAPRNQISLRSSFDVTRRVDWDVWFRFVDDIEEVLVDEYETIDTRIAWRPRRGMELALVGQNLLEAKHAEVTPSYSVERGVYGKLTLEF